MNNTTEISRDSAVADGHAAALLAQIALSRAAELGRSGHFDDAEQVLGAAGQLAEPPVLDLLARFRVQQGRLVEAQALWGEAARSDPHNESYRRALQRLARMNQHSNWLDAGRMAALAGALALLIVVLAVTLHSWWLHERVGMVSELRASNIQPVPRKFSEVTVNGRGISERVEGSESVIRFDEGLFQHSDVLTDRGRALLEDVGSQLGQVSGYSALCVVGYSDNVPIPRRSRFRDNQFLALARANEAAQIIAASSRVPGRLITLQSSPGSLYPNDNPANRAKNRSVELRIQMRQE